jgi:putative transposase
MKPLERLFAASVKVSGKPVQAQIRPLGREGDHMRKSRFTETQIVAILKAHDAGTPTAELARKHGIHPNTLRLWRAKYGGMDATDVAKIRTLTEENERLKWIVAELHLDKHAYKLLVEKNGWGPRSGKPR